MLKNRKLASPSPVWARVKQCAESQAAATSSALYVRSPSGLAFFVSLLQALKGQHQCVSQAGYFIQWL